MTLLLKSFSLALCCIVFAAALPTSIVEDVKSDELNNKKVKRAQLPLTNAEEPLKDTGVYFSPTAIKRGVNLKTDQLPLLSEWDQQRYRQADSIQSPLFAGEDELDDKTLAEYEKGFRYGTNKDRLNEALQNAILKSELYGDDAALNQYRYYGNDDRRRRKRRNVQKMRLSNRYKRDVDLSPEDFLTILTFLENERELSPNTPYRKWPRYDAPYDLELEKGDEPSEGIDGDWLETPVYPHADERASPPSPNYYYETNPKVFEKRGRWSGFSENRHKRFMVAKKRNDPTREIHYLNGPAQNDFYTLSELIGSQREPEVPLYQRYVL